MHSGLYYRRQSGDSACLRSVGSTDYILTKPSLAITFFLFIIVDIYYNIFRLQLTIFRKYKIQNQLERYTARKASTLFLELTVAVYPNIFMSRGGKDDQCLGMVTLPPLCVNCIEILGGSNSWRHKDLSRPGMG